MPHDAIRSLGFYCRAHSLRFHAIVEAVIRCKRGHTLGDGFPDNSWWDYCCDCDTFWPSEGAIGHLEQSECVLCERPTQKRYLCDKCQVMSIESSALVRRKLHSIEGTSGINPNCPGCASGTRGTSTEHHCDERGLTFFTLRHTCPFCKKTLANEESKRPIAVGSEICSSCGTPGNPTENFCGRCGKPQLRDVREPSITAVKQKPFEASLAPEVNLSQSPLKARGGLPSERRTDRIPDNRQSQNIQGIASQAGREHDHSAQLDSLELVQSATIKKTRGPLALIIIAIGFSLGFVLIFAVIVANRRVDSAKNPSVQAKPAQTTPPEMIFVKGGEFIMGSDSGDDYEKPAHNVTVKPFFIDVYEVTCSDYEKFVKAANHRAPIGWIKGVCPTGATRNPVTGVDWYDATAYAQWAGKRLPTEEEWELAARGTDKRIYPWGNDWRENAANAGDRNHGRVVDVGSYPDGKSPFGVLDMIGNAWEWTSSDLKTYPGGHISDQAPGELKVIRGGYWGSSAPKATTTFRRGWDARDAQMGYKNTGFRCARDS